MTNNTAITTEVSANGGKPRQKRTRVYAPKVRTGCLTCNLTGEYTRARRKKCGEEKPTCRRCKDGGWKCDGYAQVDHSHRSNATLRGTASSSPGSSIIGSPRGNGTPPGKPPARVTPPMRVGRPQDVPRRPTVPSVPPGRSPISINDPSPTPSDTTSSVVHAPALLYPTRVFSSDDDVLELRFLGHFFTCTLEDILYTNGPQDFWRRTLPSLVKTEPLIRHAVTALGTSHWLFMGQEYATPGQVAASEALLIQQYNQAIAHLVQPQDASPNVHLILICCLLFIYLEVLRGSRTEAFKHLGAGSRLLASLKDTLTGPAPAPCDGTLREIASLFRGIGSDVTPFTYDRLLSDLAPFANPVAGSGDDAGRPYGSLAEVQDELAEIEMQMYDFEWASNRYEKWADVPVEMKAAERASWDTVKRRFLLWESRFDVTLEALGLDGAAPQDYELLNLRLQRRMWHLMVDDDDEDSWDSEPTMEPGECHDIMDEVERLLAMTAPTTRVFTVHADLIPMLIVLYGACPDTGVRRRVIALLRSRRRREIVWDSEEVAQFLEQDLERCVLGEKDAEWPEIGPCSDAKALLFYRPQTQTQST